ncbi:MAG: hypothetical protein QW255_05235 [Candidatus Bilamarchaeaceae archaeon]
MKKLNYRVIVFSGIDGCGKTTIIEQLRSILEHRGIKTQYVWLRYNHFFVKPILFFCKLIGLTTYEVIGDIRIGYHNFYKSRLISGIFICLTFWDTFLATLFKICIPLIFTRNLIICDRWVVDILVDLEIDTGIPLFKKFCCVWRHFCKKFFLRTWVVILIKRSRELVLADRLENRYSKTFIARYQLYETYSLLPCIKTVSNNGNISETVKNVMAAVSFI